MPDGQRADAKNTALLFIHALTSLHPGSGTALGHVDLPVARERHTQWPLIPASTLKGVLRDACRTSSKDEDDPGLLAVFGPKPGEGANEHAGAISLTDARILAFPVRSLVGVFAWVTCPAVLQRLNRDLQLVGEQALDIANVCDLKGDEAACNSPLLIDGNSLVLEEFDFVRMDADGSAIANWIAECAVIDASTTSRIKTHLVIVADDAFGHFVRYATEVTARIGLEYETKTVKDGALFYEEFLPPETLFYSLVFAEKSRSNKMPMKAVEIMSYVQERAPNTLQIGADETIGKGLCAVSFWPQPQQVPA